VLVDDLPAFFFLGACDDRGLLPSKKSSGTSSPPRKGTNVSPQPEKPAHAAFPPPNDIRDSLGIKGKTIIPSPPILNRLVLPPKCHSSSLDGPQSNFPFPSQVMGSRACVNPPPLYVVILTSRQSLLRSNYQVAFLPQCRFFFSRAGCS